MNAEPLNLSCTKDGVRSHLFFVVLFMDFLQLINNFVLSYETNVLYFIMTHIFEIQEESLEIIL